MDEMDARTGMATGAATASYPFTKKIDAKTGQFYYIDEITGETTWDAPSGINVPLREPTEEARRRLAFQHHQRFVDREARRHERLDLIDKIRSRHRVERERERTKKEQDEWDRQDAVWKDACERGRSDGSVRVSWYEYGYISDRVYAFREEYKRDLINVVLMGNALKSLESLPSLCSDQILHLNLASNRISNLAGVTDMVRLQHLNLMKNEIEQLPANFGDALSCLTVLELANNMLTEIPPSIGRLDKLKRINLECNRITHLPETLGRMSCEVLLLNSNKLLSLPCGLCAMSKLRVLSVNNNQLKYLPADIGRSSSLEVLHAGRNALMELPDSITRIATLTCLWLDFNKLSALPVNFHNLNKLRELKLDGNIDITFPTMDILALGPAEVLKWSERRLASRQHIRAQNIVLAVQDVLVQVGRNRISRNDGSGSAAAPHESLFRNNVESDGSQWFQFPPDALWSTFLPSLEAMWKRQRPGGSTGVRSFPYERREVEETLANFCDAAGPILGRNPRAWFRRCSCISNGQKKQVCVPPKKGWMCERPALLVRKAINLERDMTDRRRRENEEKRIGEAEMAAERLAKVYLSTDEGKLFIRESAENQISSNALSEQSRNLGDLKRSSNRIAGLSSAMSGRNRKDKLKEAEEMLKQEFIDKEVRDRRDAAVETNEKMKRIMESWFGLSMEDTFVAWKEYILKVKKLRRREERQRQRMERLFYEEEMARLALAEEEVHQWTRQWDEFNDVPFWVRHHTEEVIWEEPTIGRFLPPGWKKPAMPSSMFDANTGFVYSPRTIRQNESGSSPSTAKSDDFSTENEDSDSETELSLASESIEAESAKNGKDKEILLAASRVLERRRKQLEESMKKKSCSISI